MPIAAVNENDFSELREDKIGFSGEVGIVEPEFVTKRTSNPSDEEFRLSVLSANKRHPPAALDRRQCIH